MTGLTELLARSCPSWSHLWREKRPSRFWFKPFLEPKPLGGEEITTDDACQSRPGKDRASSPAILPDSTPQVAVGLQRRDFGVVLNCSSIADRGFSAISATSKSVLGSVRLVGDQT